MVVEIQCAISHGEHQARLWYIAEYISFCWKLNWFQFDKLVCICSIQAKREHLGTLVPPSGVFIGVLFLLWLGIASFVQLLYYELPCTNFLGLEFSLVQLTRKSNNDSGAFPMRCVVKTVRPLHFKQSVRCPYH